MAKFIGTVDEFKKYMSGYCRNTVQVLSKKYTKDIGKCENVNCKNKKDLQAAHSKKSDRQNIIVDAIKASSLNYSENEDLEIDLPEFEKYFIEAHQPICDVVYILCRSCHTAYDYDQLSDKNFKKVLSRDNPDGTLLIELKPKYAPTFKKALLDEKKAYIYKFTSEGFKERTEWNANRFSKESNLWSNIRSQPDLRRQKWEEDKLTNVLISIKECSDEVLKEYTYAILDLDNDGYIDDQKS